MKSSRTLALLFAPLLLALGACDFLNGGQDVPLQAVISVDHPSGTLVAPDATVTFDSRDSRGRIASHEWSIDGAVVATAPSFTRQFSAPGTYEVVLTIRNAQGETDTDPISYRVMSLAESYGADHVLTPDEFSGYNFDLTPNGQWGILSDQAWLAVQPALGTGGPATLSLTVNPALLPEGQATPTAHLKYFDNDGEREIVVVALLPELVLPHKVVMPSARLEESTSTWFALRNTGAHPSRVTLSLNPRVAHGVVLELDSTTAVINPTGHPSLFELTAQCPAYETLLEGELLISTDDPRGGEYAVEVEIACREAPVQEFQIELVFKEGAFTPEQKEMMEAAARRWEEIVIGDIPGTDSLHRGGHEACLRVISEGDTIAEELEGNRHVDDLLIYVYKTKTDMHANTLARGGPCVFPDLNRLPNHGMVMINPAHLDDMTERDYLTATMVHEIGHALGVGTLWRSREMIYPSIEQCRTGSTAALTFEGPLAAVEFQALGGAGAPPIANDCAHWERETFQNESMSPVITITPDGVHSPVSAVTVASLADLGYVVDYAAADHFALPGAFSLSAQAQGEQREHGAPIIGIVHP